MCNPVNIAFVNWSDPENQAALRSVRTEVFLREQKVAVELEWDEFDEKATHLLAKDSFGAPIATARMLPDGHIGRVAVIPPWRERGVGSELVKTLIQEARRRGWAEVDLDAQTHAVSFYERLGFAAEGEEFFDAGIPHRRMRLKLVGRVT
jgi:predicted GNAT family N-acyltransferase